MEVVPKCKHCNRRMVPHDPPTMQCGDVEFSLYDCLRCGKRIGINDKPYGCGGFAVDVSEHLKKLKEATDGGTANA